MNSENHSQDQLAWSKVTETWQEPADGSIDRLLETVLVSTNMGAGLLGAAFLAVFLRVIISALWSPPGSDTGKPRKKNLLLF